MTDQATQLCDNCHKQFPQNKIATHFGYCRRNIKKCQTCGQMFDINFKEDHQQQFHKQTPCKHCKKTFKPNQVIKHQQSCFMRTQYCEYCQLDVPLKDYSRHLKDCQSRTKQCQKCRKPISNKDFLIHTISCPGYVQQSKPAVQNTPHYSNYDQYLRNAQRKQKNGINQIRHTYQQNNNGVKYQYKPQNQYKPSSEFRGSYQQKKPQINLNNRVRQKQPIYSQIQTNVTNFSHNPKQNLERGRDNSNNRNGIVNNRDLGTNFRENGINKQNYPINSINQNKINNPIRQSHKQQIPSSNKYGISSESNNNQKKVITTTTVYDRQKKSAQGLGSNKNIDNKYEPSTKIINNNPTHSSSNSNKPASNINSYQNKVSYISGANKNQITNANNSKPPSSITNFNNQVPSSKYQPKSYSNQQSSQYENNREKIVPGNNYPKINQNHRKQIIRQQAFIKKQNQYKQKQKRQNNQFNIKDYGVDLHDFQDVKYLPRQQPRRHIPSQQPYGNNQPSSYGDHDEDQELQKAIMASIVGVVGSKKSPNKYSQPTRPAYKIQDFPVQEFQNDILNQSFCEKQKAIMEDFQKRSRNR